MDFETYFDRKALRGNVQNSIAEETAAVLRQFCEQEPEVLPEVYTEAVKLDKHIKVHVQIAQESLYEVCTGLKKMKDSRLYRELNYSRFEDYCQAEIGVTKQQAYRYISIAENLSENFVKSTLRIGVEKFALLAKLDEQTREELQQKTDVQEVSVRELKEEIKRLKEAHRAETDKLQSQIASKHKDWMNATNEITALTSKNYSLEQQVSELENQVEDLESRPVEVAVQEVSASPEKSPEYKNLMQAMHHADHEWAEKYDALQEQSWQEMNQLKRDHQDEIIQKETEIQELQSQLAEQSTQMNESPESRQFRIYLMTVGNSMTQLLDFLCEHPQDMFLHQSEILCRDAENSLTEIRKQVQT